MNLPNSLTILRVILIPFFVIFMKTDLGGSGKYIALAIFIIASLTDSLDGYLARKKPAGKKLWKIYRSPCG